MKEEILQRIESAGVTGIKKADLKKTYGKDCEEIIERLQKEEKIFIEKKGVAYFVWIKDNYILHLTENDPKFKLMLNMVVGVSHSISKLKEQTYTLRQEMEDLSLQDNAEESVDFEREFNQCLCESGTSVGWAPFSKIREKMCQTKNLSKEKFYTLATNLIEKHRERYEISSGGPEGVVVRGLVHGYVRNV
ncbi:Uncharacterised protein [uncultured archaeon]|nr:Uncharacterised protein [uncultured archaeon]